MRRSSCYCTCCVDGVMILNPELFGFLIFTFPTEWYISSKFLFIFIFWVIFPNILVTNCCSQVGWIRCHDGVWEYTGFRLTNLSQYSSILLANGSLYKWTLSCLNADVIDHVIQYHSYVQTSGCLSGCLPWFWSVLGVWMSVRMYFCGSKASQYRMRWRLSSHSTLRNDRLNIKGHFTKKYNIVESFAIRRPELQIRRAKL